MGSSKADPFMGQIHKRFTQHISVMGPKKKEKI